MRSLVVLVVACIYLAGLADWIREKIDAMKKLLPLLTLLLMGTAQAQPTSLVEATDTTWTTHGLQVHVSGTDTAWVYEGPRDTLWHAEWQGRTLVKCYSDPFDVATLASDARAVLRRKEDNGINDTFGRKAECITTFPTYGR